MSPGPRVKLVVADDECILMESAPSQAFAAIAVQLAMTGALVRLQDQGRDADFAAMMCGNIGPVREFLKDIGAHPQFIAGIGLALSYFVYKGDLGHARRRLIEIIATTGRSPMSHAEVEGIEKLGADFLYEAFLRERAKEEK